MLFRSEFWNDMRVATFHMKPELHVYSGENSRCTTFLGYISDYETYCVLKHESSTN